MSSANPAEAGSIEIAPSVEGERLDRFLSSHLDLPRNQIQNWIREGHVTVSDAPTKASHRLVAHEVVAWRAPPPVPEELEPEEGRLDVLFEDPHLIVLDKPPGLVVHPGAGRATGTLVHRVLAHYPEVSGVGGRGRPGIVHRLDKDTSGIMVLARTAGAYRALSRAFASREVDKTYVALLYGPSVAPRWTVSDPIGRHPSDRLRMTVRSDGRPATSHFEVEEQIGNLLRTKVQIETGRTHQIRVHAKHAGTPLIGDPLYGEARWKALPRALQRPLRTFPRPALHAHRLAFRHPVDRVPLEFESPIAKDLDALWSDLVARSKS
ncbi:MAG: RluA family pseudouridine synthase [Thermoanaerobaculia bacterium]|nr:RluA family pseudouridine synthase [Thermoanaerobaculia bacterium]